MVAGDINTGLHKRSRLYQLGLVPIYVLWAVCCCLLFIGALSLNTASTHVSNLTYVNATEKGEQDTPISNLQQHSA
jgi:hypothetical protein